MRSPAFTHSKVATALVSTAGIAIAMVVGYFLHQEARARLEAREVVVTVRESTAQLKLGLKLVPEALAKLEKNLATAKEWSDVEMAEAAEEYILGAREILRRRAEATRLARKAAASRAALAAHMHAADRRNSAWIRNATQLKRQVERDHFDLNVQLSALADLLQSLPEANKRLAPHVEASLLLDDATRRSAHSGVLAEAKRADAQLQKTRSLLR
jgi:hypothetical protein